jgi:hypothetical protein
MLFHGNNGYENAQERILPVLFILFPLRFFDPAMQ